MRHVLSLAAVASTLLLAAPAAQGAVFRTPRAPSTLPTTGSFLDNPAVAIARSGEAIAFWRDGTGTDMDAAYRPPGGDWTAMPFVATDTAGFSTDIAVDAAGNATVVWREGSNGQHWTAYRPAGAAAFDPPVAIGPDTSGDSSLAVAPDGRAVIAFISPSKVTRAVIRQPGATTFFDGADPGDEPDALLLSTSTNKQRNSTAATITSDGRTFVFWQDADDKDISFSVREPAVTAFSGESDLVTPSGVDGVFAPETASDGSGILVVTYIERPAVGQEIMRGTRLVAPGGNTFTAPETFSDVTGDITTHDVAVLPDGTAYALWRDLAGPLMTARQAPGEQWTPVGGDDVAPSNVQNESVVAAADGTVVASWGGSASLALVRSLVPPVAANPTEELQTPGENAQDPDVAIDADGDLVDVWIENSSPDRVRAELGDGEPSTLTSFTAPTATLRTGENGTFEAAATPDFAGVAPTPTVDFGDGTSATGTSVTHAYANPGTYTATVTASDSFGQPTDTRTATVTVVPAEIPACCAPPPGVRRTTPPDSDIAAIGSRVRRGRLRTIQGSASDQLDLARVEIALIRLRGRARFVATAAATKRRCLSLRTTGRLRRQKGACRARTFLAATGTTTWRFALRRRLPRGKYVVVSRAIAADGTVEPAFSAGDRNLRRFRVVR